MKSLYTPLLLLTLLALLSASPCLAQKSTGGPYVPAHLSAPVCQPQGWSPLPNLTIGVQEGIELMSIIQYLGGHLENNTPSPYKNDVRKYFTPYRNHPAVLAMFNFDYRIYSDLVECGLTMSDFPHIQRSAVPDSSVWYKSFSKDSLNWYLDLCLQFYKDTHFHDFYMAHQAMYKSWAEGLTKSVKEPIRIFDSLIDLKAEHRWMICMDPINDWGAHTIMPDHMNNAYAGYYIYQLGYFGDKDSAGNMSFGADLYDFVWHEGTHAFTGPLLDKYKSSVDSLSYLMPNSAVLRHQSIQDGDFEHYFNELLPRAVSMALTRQFRSNEEYQNLLDSEKNRRGFVHVDTVADLIYTDYVHERKVPNFEGVLLEIFAMLHQKYPSKA